MTTVGHILQSKTNNSVHTISPDVTVIQAAKLMANMRVGGLVVTDDQSIVGIVTERDFARKLALIGAHCGDMLVREIMSTPVMYVRPEYTTNECMALMTENRLRHLPVVVDGKLIGLVSIGDLVKNVISHQQFMIEQLEHYIKGDLG